MSPWDIACRHALPPPHRGGGDRRPGEVGSQAEPYGIETGEGGCTPLPVSPSKNFVLLMLLPFGQSHSPMAILSGKPWMSAQDTK
jgi:hypothetical protein